MKKYVFPLFLIVYLFYSGHITAQEGIGTNLPDKSAALEIMSSKRGLLIPRITIPDLSQAAPVTNPANALMVYNNNISTNPGFYYWHEEAGTGPDNGYWDPIGKTTTTTAANFGIGEGENIRVDTLITGNDTIYKIGIETGQNGQVLVSQIDQNNEMHSVWVDPGSFIKNVVGADNGLHRDIDPVTDSISIKLGGSLNEATTISTDATNTLSIFGLDTIAGGDLSNYNIMVLDNTGLLKVVPTSDLSTGTTQVQVKNGLTIDADTILLGGVLDRPTTITTNDTNTLAIKGLENATDPNEIVVVEDNNGTLRTVTRSLSQVITQNFTIDDQNMTGYSPYVQEININVDVSDLGSNDIDLTLPNASTAEGQVINVKLTDDTNNGDADNYLNILDNTNTTLTYGGLPYQSWILKSNGAKWEIVAKN